MSKDVFEIFQRDSNKITISEFYEGHTLKKYNFDPPYQRDYNVWSDEKQSFLIDTILKNYPMPPIFLESKIVNRQSKYDVVDGKQRLTSIIKFIENEIKLPNDFDSDAFGNTLLNGLKIEDIEKLAENNIYAKKYMDNFWQYKISVEYIENPSERVVDAVFDRLNRGGERLTPAELRRANYYYTLLNKLIVEISKIEFWEKLLDGVSNINKKRLDHHSFLSELVFLLLEGKIIESTEDAVDNLYEKWSELMDEDTYNSTLSKFVDLTKKMEDLQIDYDRYRVRGVSHIYALWSFLLFALNEHDLDNIREIGIRINDMYNSLRQNDNNPYVEIYKATMQSGSKKLSQRRRRINAIADYTGCTLDTDIG